MAHQEHHPSLPCTTELVQRPQAHARSTVLSCWRRRSRAALDHHHCGCQCGGTKFRQIRGVGSRHVPVECMYCRKGRGTRNSEITSSNESSGRKTSPPMQAETTRQKHSHCTGISTARAYKTVPGLWSLFRASWVPTSTGDSSTTRRSITYAKRSTRPSLAVPYLPSRFQSPETVVSTAPLAPTAPIAQRLPAIPQQPAADFPQPTKSRTLHRRSTASQLSAVSRLLSTFLI